VYRLNRAASAVEVFHGISDDGLWGLVTGDSTSTAPVVYLHKPYTQLQVCGFLFIAQLYMALPCVELHACVRACMGCLGGHDCTCKVQITVESCIHLPACCAMPTAFLPCQHVSCCFSNPR
jgi:hypothetical protein